MAGINGKWRFTAQENLEAYHTAKKTPEAYKDFLKALGAEIKTNPDAYLEEFKVDTGAGTVTRTAFIRGEKKRDVTVPIGGEAEVTLADGRQAKGRVTIESANKITLTEKGGDFDSSTIYEVKGSELIVAQTCSGNTATLKFTKA